MPDQKQDIEAGVQKGTAPTTTSESSPQKDSGAAKPVPAPAKVNESPPPVGAKANLKGDTSIMEMASVFVITPEKLSVLRESMIRNNRESWKVVFGKNPASLRLLFPWSILTLFCFGLLLIYGRRDSGVSRTVLEVFQNVSNEERDNLYHFGNFARILMVNRICFPIIFMIYAFSLYLVFEGQARWKHAEDNRIRGAVVIQRRGFQVYHWLNWGTLVVLVICITGMASIRAVCDGECEDFQLRSAGTLSLLIFALLSVLVVLVQILFRLLFSVAVPREM